MVCRQITCLLQLEVLAHRPALFQGWKEQEAEYRFGICVGVKKKAQEEKVFDLVQRTSEFLEISGSVNRDAVVPNGDYVGPGYGKPTEGMIEAVQLLACEEGILLDPVYSGKGMAGLIDLVRKGYFSKGENVVFLHTGGSAALFAYRNILAT
ncbi:MAG: hypothetical protein CM1200mP28_08250 [Deltaproteobacteria bacterium]|nr:MAG: hypothetical protein CM1200mP28_08250 [Deltaproteobacteria bacterium]